jgi:hypothetical protein
MKKFFIIPSKPITVADISDPIRDASSKDKTGDKYPTSITNAAYFDGSLLTLSDDGKMQKWPEGSRTGSSFETLGYVGSFCTMDGKIFLLTGDKIKKSITLWSGMPTAWTQVTQFQQSEKSYFRALDCTGNEPLLLFSKSIQFPLSEKQSRSILNKRAQADLPQHCSIMDIFMSVSMQANGAADCSVTC